VCECGEKKTEPHSFTEFSSENGSQTVIKNVCPCGVAITEYDTPQAAIHVHAVEYAYDENNHWQICADESCTDEYSTAPQAHSFTTLTDERGNKGYVCSICKCYVVEGAATLRGTVTSFNDASGDITLQLIPEGFSEPAYETIVKGNTVDYYFADVAAGTYTLRVSKANHVTREYTVVVGNGSVETGRMPRG
jgi:hypothetical protein